MNKKFRFLLGAFLLLIMISGKNVSGAIDPVNFRVDDTFNFEVTKVYEDYAVNGTSYPDKNTTYVDEGTTMEVKVNKIDDDDQPGSTSTYFGVATSDTFVDISESVNPSSGDNFKENTTVYLNEWLEYMYIGLGAIFTTAFTSPILVDYSGPTIDSPVPQEKSDAVGLPFLATSNTTYYNTVDQALEDLDDNSNENFTIMVDSGLDDAKEHYNVEVSYRLKYQDEYNSAPYSFNGGFALSLTIDLTRSILTNFDFKFDSTHKYDGGEIYLESGLVFKEGDTKGDIAKFIDNLPVPLPGITYFVSSFAVIALVVRKKKNE